MRRRLLQVAALLVLASTPPAPAQQLHRIERGETARSLAERYYDDDRFAELISAHNKLRGEPRAGAEIRIPSASQHRVRQGESWSDLAARYWSDASLGGLLAEWCGAGPSVPPRPGTSLTVPALVGYRLRPGETLVSLSRRFFGGPQRTEALGRLNRIPNPDRVRSGQLIRIPLLVVARGPSAEEARTAASADDALETRRDVAAAPPPTASVAPAKALMGAVNAYLDGSFEVALERLEALRPQILQEGTAAEQGLLLRYLAFSYIAFDRSEEACNVFVELRKREPKLKLDPELVSPKIRDVLASCG